jgi:hypothetical protein
MSTHALSARAAPATPREPRSLRPPPEGQPELTILRDESCLTALEDSSRFAEELRHRYEAPYPISLQQTAIRQNLAI